MRNRDKIKKFSFIINFLLLIMKLLPKKVRIYFFYNSIYRKGNFGLLIRYVLIKSIAKKCGENIAIFPGVYIYHPENLELGSNVSIHEMSYIDCLNSDIVIGNDVSIAHGVTILSSSHNFVDKKVNIKDQGLIFKKTIIKNNVWIGAKATILAGIIIESGSVIGAGAVVTKNVMENSVVGGVPAKLIKKR